MTPLPAALSPCSIVDLTLAFRKVPPRVRRPKRKSDLSLRVLVGLIVVMAAVLLGGLLSSLIYQ